MHECLKKFCNYCNKKQPSGEKSLRNILLQYFLHHDDCALLITLVMFSKDFYVLGFNLTSVTESDEEHIRLPRQGNVRIESCFKKNLYRNT